MSAEHDQPPPGYPAQLAHDVVLANGGMVHVRAILPHDGPRLERLHARLSPRTLYRRFLAPVPRLVPSLLRQLVTVDYVDRLALVALSGDDVLGVARFDRLGAGSDEAEVAVVVEDAWQGCGVGTALLRSLADAARQRGVRWFVASVLGENVPMVALLSHLGAAVRMELVGSQYRVRVDLGTPVTPG